MLLTKFQKNIIQTTLCHLKTQMKSKGCNSLVNYCTYSTKLLQTIFSPNKLQTRNYFKDSHNDVQLPALSDDPPIVWPSFFKTINTFIQCNLIIRPYMDNDFIMSEFLEGSKQALNVVSNALAKEDYDSIKDLVTIDTIQSTRNKISTLNLEQKQLLAIDKEDIYMTFPYQVGIIFDNTAHQRFVEILVVFHSLRGLGRMRREKKEPPLNMGLLPEYQRLMFVCNYRFIREFTKGTQSSWTINMINHFMPALL